jgi:hypothetical protein
VGPSVKHTFGMHYGIVCSPFFEFSNVDGSPSHMETPIANPTANDTASNATKRNFFLTAPSIASL